METPSKKPGAASKQHGRVTLRDNAAKVGVSHVTVSLALRNHPSIPLKRREQVKKVAEVMGYRPDPLLSSLVVYCHSKRPVQVQSSLAWINQMSLGVGSDNPAVFFRLVYPKSEPGGGLKPRIGRACSAVNWESEKPVGGCPAPSENGSRSRSCQKISSAIYRHVITTDRTPFTHFPIPDSPPTKTSDHEPDADSHCSKARHHTRQA